MNAHKTKRALAAAAALAAMTITGMTSACYAVSLAPAKQVRAAEAGAAKPRSVSLTLPVTSLIGDAMLEEYHGGDPTGRTMTYREGAVARQTSIEPAGKGKCHS